MNTSSLLLSLALGTIGLAGGWFLAMHHEHKEEAQTLAPARGAEAATAKAHLYQCSMHPWIRSDHPGAKCTICGMELVQVSDGGSSETPPGVVPLSASSITVLGIKTAAAAKRPLERTLRVAGTIDDDASRHRILSAFAPGWIERLQVNFVGAPVRAGQPLLTLYSQGILSAEWEWINAFRAGDVSTRSAGLARGRLRAIGLTEEQIDQLKTRSEPEQLTTLVSPMDGTVVMKNVYPGQNVAAGDKLFEIADFSTMWFQFEAYEQDLPWIRLGQRVEVETRAAPGKTFEAVISFIDPNFNETTRSTLIRVELPNPVIGEGETAARAIPHRVSGEGVVHLTAPQVLAIPRSAVLDAGMGPVAYVDLGGSAYEQRLLKLGRVGDADVEILEGIKEGEAVVTQGNLLVDAQAQLSREAAGYSHDTPPTLDGAHVVTNALHLESTPNQSMPGTSSSGITGSLGALAEAASTGSEALASDDFPRYQKIFPTLESTSRGITLPPLVLGDDLPSARRSFEVWSTAVVDLIRPQQGKLGVKIFQCPMAPVLKRARWIQKGDQVRNPFFGSTMLECGVELK